MAYYDKEYWELIDQRMRGINAEKEFAKAELAKDPRIALVPRSVRGMFVKTYAGEEREQILARYQREADRKANLPKRFWEIWKR